MSGDPYELDRRAVRRSFGAAAPRYEAAAQLQAGVRLELLDRCELLLRGSGSGPLAILDLGTGTGAALAELQRRWPKARLIAVDAAPPMIEIARARLPAPGLVGRLRGLPPGAAICADAAQLPLADGTVDLVYSNLMLQWCADLDQTLREMRRVLRPGGLLALTTFGPDTLRELRTAWSAVDGHTHVSRFIDMHDIGDALVRNGFQEPVLDVDRLRTEHADPIALMRHLKEIGARNATAGRSGALAGRHRLTALSDAYPRNPDGAGIVASWEVIYVSAFAGDARAQTSDEFTVDVARLQQRLAERRREGRR